MNSKLLLCLLFLSLPAFGGTLPNNIMVIGYDGEAWFPYLTIDGGWHKVDSIRNPSSVTWKINEQTLFFKGNDTRLYKYYIDEGKTENITLEIGDNNGFTQLRASSDKETDLTLIKLIDGKSADTEIIKLVGRNKVTGLLRQSSAQFHPLIQGDYLYYAHVTCRLICKPVIQDVWRHNLKTGKTEQVTRLNSTTYLHSLTDDHRYGFISSNKSGYYNLARIDLANGSSEWLTTGQITDSYPSLADDNRLYFIRRTTSGYNLMSLASNLLEEKIELNSIKPESHQLPLSVTKIRYLEAAQ